MIFETLDRIGPFVVVCSQSASIPAKKRRVLVRCVNCNATQEMLASSLSDKRLFDQSVCSRCRPRNGNPHTWATRAKFEELKMTMEKDLAEAQAAVRETLAQLRTVLQERDEARAEAASSLAMARIADEKHEWKCAEIDMLRGVGCMEDGDGPCGVCRKCAYRRGAEAMREACAKWVDHWVSGHVADKLRDLPIPEEI